MVYVAQITEAEAILLWLAPVSIVVGIIGGAILCWLDDWEYPLQLRDRWDAWLERRGW